MTFRISKQRPSIIVIDPIGAEYYIQPKADATRYEHPLDQADDHDVLAVRGHDGYTPPPTPLDSDSDDCDSECEINSQDLLLLSALGGDPEFPIPASAGTETEICVVDDPYQLVNDEKLGVSAVGSAQSALLSAVPPGSGPPSPPLEIISSESDADAEPPVRRRCLRKKQPNTNGPHQQPQQSRKAEVAACVVFVESSPAIATEPESMTEVEGNAVVSGSVDDSVNVGGSHPEVVAEIRTPSPAKPPGIVAAIQSEIREILESRTPVFTKSLKRPQAVLDLDAESPPWLPKLPKLKRSLPMVLTLRVSRDLSLE